MAHGYCTIILKQKVHARTEGIKCRKIFFTSLLEAALLSLGSRAVKSANSQLVATFARSGPVVVGCLSARPTGNKINSQTLRKNLD